MSGARIAIDGTDRIRMRAASALAADHRIARIGLIGRGAPDAWGDRVTTIASAVGWDVTVGAGAPAVPQVTVGPEGDVNWAGPSGLARSLAERLGSHAVIAATVVGDEIDGSERFAFPPPIGWLGGDEADGIFHCPTRGDLASIMASTDRRSLAVLDTRDFLDGALLAAGVLLAVEGHRGPVWEAADRYLHLVSELGLVLADTAA
ncbi:MAG: hypothetical protein ACLGHX_12120 [Acidimicrobiia bacterium]